MSKDKLKKYIWAALWWSRAECPAWSHSRIRSSWKIPPRIKYGKQFVYSWNGSTSQHDPFREMFQLSNKEDGGISCNYFTNREEIGFEIRRKLDWELIRSSPRNGLGTPCRLTIRNSARLFHHVLFNMVDLHLVLPALNLSTLNAGILIMVQQVR